MPTTREEFIIKGIYNGWLKNAIALINDSYGLTFSVDNPTRIKQTFVYDTYADYSISINRSQELGVDWELIVNLAKWTNINENNSNGNGFDIALAEELAHTVMKAQINDFNVLPSWFIKGAAELVCGGDSNYSIIRTLLRGSTSSLGSYYRNGSSADDTPALGYMLLRYYAEESSRHMLDTPAQVIVRLMDAVAKNYGLSRAIQTASEGTFTDTENLINSFIYLIEDASITSDSGADTFIKNVASIDYSDFGTIDSGAITGSDAGGDTPKSYTDILKVETALDEWELPTENQYTYEGVTIFFPIATSHDDYITNSNDDTMISALGGNDTIINTGARVSISGGTGNDFIHNHGNGRRSTILGGNGGDYILNECAYVIINGDSGDDTIYGGDSYTTVSGGAGDDYIILTSGRGTTCTYQIGDGNDTIEGFDQTSKLYVTGNFFTIESGNDIIIDFDGGSMILQEVGGRNLYAQDMVDHTIITVGETVATSANSIEPVTPTESATNYFYGGGNATINNYDASKVITIGSDFAGIGFDENNFYMNSSTGTLTIKNIRDKVISYGDTAGNLTAYSYVASGGGNIDWQYFPQCEVIIGGDFADNLICAGSGGSSLWGGVGGQDTLIGGSGYDEFFFAAGAGYDVIQNASAGDMINLFGLTLDDISSTYVNESAVSINFWDGSNLRVDGNSGVGYILGTEIYFCNQSTGTWTTS